MQMFLRKLSQQYVNILFQFTSQLSPIGLGKVKEGYFRRPARPSGSG